MFLGVWARMHAIDFSFETLVGHGRCSPGRMLRFLFAAAQNRRVVERRTIHD